MKALALDPNGHPRFLMHTYRAYLGIGQKPPKTFYAACDARFRAMVTAGALDEARAMRTFGLDPRQH